jgi:phosphoglycolate phosphatase
MKRLTVFFPGVGYTPDKPLLYHSRRIAASLGYDCLVLTFSGFPKKIKGDEKKMRKAFDLALSQSRAQLKEANLPAYDEIIFIGKSIGAVAAAALAAEFRCSRLVLYTPLEPAFSFPLPETIVFTGSADPWVGRNQIPALCAGLGIPCTVIPEANHSLETGEPLRDLERLRDMMMITQSFLKEGRNE